MISVAINDNGTVQQLHDLRERMQRPRALMAAVGRRGAMELKKYFRGKDDTPNQLGGQRQHFWLQVSQSVQAPVLQDDGTTVVISVNHPAIAQKVFGGTITAKRVKNLAIPVDPEAYGRAPAVFEAETGLQLVFIKSSGKALLATRAAAGGLQVRYLLTPSVDQSPDPTALPDMSDGSAFAEALIETGQAALDTETRRLNS
ncbi:MAG: hypothetical protein ACYDH9_08175 [Limisphaerales bacterium]